nr:HD domain-containing phosphohydrolase [Quadrisphaera sp. RL12-1S]
MAVRVAVVVGPFVLALVVGLVAAVALPPDRLGLPVWLWLGGVVLLTSGALFVCSRWLRRLAPLSALLRLTLVLPDGVPHRFTLARRRWSPGALEGSHRGGEASGQRVLALVATLAAHDDRTRAHGERVQAYAALIGRELGLSEPDVDRLSWVALLHDVGKVHVPVEVINKTGRPSEEEWAQLQGHPHHGGELVAPLRDWLGDWLDGVEQHHERWDGRGYPRALAGEDISLAARIIAVADTYDVITSARSYKKPMTAEQARAEITRCAGEQFDPAVVRALLGVGIGSLRRVAGPATLLAALPFGLAAPAQAATAVTSAASTAGAHALTAVAVAAAGVGGAVTAAGAFDLPAATAAARTQLVAAVLGDDDGGAASPSTAAAPGSGSGADPALGRSATPAVTGGAAAAAAPDAAGAPAAGQSGAVGTPSGSAALAGGTPAAPSAAGAGTSAAEVRTGASSSGVPLAGPSVSVPGVSVPGVSGPSVSVPSVSVPGVTVPRVSVPGGTVPPVSVPSVSVPPVSVPSVTVPPVSVPSVSVPSVSVPSVTVPRVSVAPSQPTSQPTSQPSSAPTSVPRITLPPVFGR